MSTLLQRALAEASRLAEDEQDRIARVVLDQMTASTSGEREPFRVRPWSFELPPDLTERELKAIAYGEHRNDSAGLHA